MNSRRKIVGTGKGKVRGNGMRVAPVTKAIRSALAFSALALAAASPAFACDIAVPNPGDTVVCDDANYGDTIDYNVDDLTVVIGDGTNTTTVTPPNGNDGVFMGGDGTQVVDVLEYAYVYANYADGIDISTGGNAEVSNEGWIDVYVGDGIEIDADGDATVFNAGGIQVAYGDGIDVFTYGSADVTNTGLVDVYNGHGIVVGANGDVSATNAGFVWVYGYDSHGIDVTSFYGTADVVNTGEIDAYSFGYHAMGIGARASGDVEVTNVGDVSADANGYAIGIYARSTSGHAQVNNQGAVYAQSDFYIYGRAAGIVAIGDTANVVNDNIVFAESLYSHALGMAAYADLDATVINSGLVVADAEYNATGMTAWAYYGDATASNSLDGFVGAYSDYGNATGVSAFSFNGDVEVSNGGTVRAETLAYSGVAVGLYGYSYDGQATVNNDGLAIAFANYGQGVADGIFATGGDVSVDNQGNAVGIGGYNGWGAGIEAQGDNSVQVTNGFYAAAYGFGGMYAFGIYATAGAGGAIVDNAGLVVGAGYYYANGIYVVTGGDVTVTNSGMTYADYSGGAALLARGIHASSYGDNAVVSVDNSGDVLADGVYGAFGIAAVSTGTGGTAEVTNSGDIYALQASNFGYGANGIIASGDAGATVTNDASGFVFADSYGYAYGIIAVSQTGDASVVNDGYVIAVGGKYNVSGVIAGSGGGTATVDNSGYIGVAGSYITTGIEASAPFGAEVDNSGDVNAAYGLFSFGVNMDGAGGDAVLNNTGSIQSYGILVSYGAYVGSTLGDAIVNNDGDIISQSYFYAFGALVANSEGDAILNNTGTLVAESAAKYAYAGLAISTYGDANIVNSGDVVSTGYYVALGLTSLSTSGDSLVQNTGDGSVIASTGQFSFALGVYARSTYGSAVVENDGDVRAYTGWWGTAIGIRANSDVELSVTNTGTVLAYSDYSRGIEATGAGNAFISNSGYLYSVGAYTAEGIASLADGDTEVNNSGFIGAYVLYSGDGTGVLVSSYGNVDVNNTGMIFTDAGQGYGDGIFAVGDTVTVDNNGDIYVRARYEGRGIVANSYNGSTVTLGADSIVDATIRDFAYGVVAVSTYGDVVITGAEGGEITAHSNYEDATGIQAISVYGNVGIDHGGYISATAYDGAAGIRSLSVNGDVEARSSGNILSYAYAGFAVGVSASSGLGSAIAGNSGDVNVYARNFRATGVMAGGETALVENTGSVYVGASNGADGLVSYGYTMAEVFNGGDVWAFSQYNMARGLYAYGYYGDASVVNSGDVVAVAGTDTAFGAIALGRGGTGSIDNSGTIAAYGANNGGVGAIAVGYYYGELSNSGSIYATATASNAYGALAQGYYGATLDNSGDVLAVAVGAYSARAVTVASAESASASNAAGGSIQAITDDGVALAVVASAYVGEASINNAGDILAESVTGDAFGAYAFGLYAAVNNAAGGSIDAITDAGEAVGAAAFSINGDAALSNAGDIHSYSNSNLSNAVFVSGYLSAEVNNSGNIHADAGAGGVAIGLQVLSGDDLVVTNSGTISASHDTNAIAVLMNAVDTAVLYNSGVIETDSAPGASVAIVGNALVNEIHNTGEINGHIITAAGEDLVNNGAGGTWTIIGNGSDLGDGADTVTNAGTIVVSSGDLLTGAGDDSFSNSGTLALAYGGVDLGAADTDNSFANSGTIAVLGAGVVNMGTPTGLLSNSGVITMVDGATDDVFTLYGNFGGTGGALQVDVDVFNYVADMFYIEGDVIGSGSQRIDVALTELPTTLDFDPVDVVVVSGDADANAFVAGNVVGFESELLDFGLSVLHSEVGTDHVFSIGITMDGLSDGGVLAATVAPGVHSLAGTSIGTLRQRVGVMPHLDDIHGLGPWVRWFDSDGDVKAEGYGLAEGENMNFSQKSDGVEVGMNFTVGNGLHYGVLLGRADGERSLLGGAGRDHTDLDTAGLYATWFKGDYYFDASWRWMDFESRLRTASAEYMTSGNARAFNLEAGYTGWKVGGMTLVPQLQYTRIKIDNMDPVSGSLTEAVLDGGESERLRVGLGLEHSFVTAGGLRVTPYGSLSAIHESDGESSFIINGDAALSGGVVADGTSTQLELGIGLQKHGWTFTGGLNWVDGGAVDSNVGGQVVVRYSW